MRQRKKQLFIVVAIAVITVLFSSAGNIINIKQRAFVHAIGIDPLPKKGYKVTMQIFKPGSSGSDTPVDVLSANIQTVESSGLTVSQAISKAQDSLGREIFSGHLQVICVNRNIDLSDPINFFEFALRNKNVYFGVKICTAENTAEEIMKTNITRGTTTSESLADTIEKYSENSMTIDCRLIDFLSCVNSPIYTAMPVLSVKNTDTQQQGGNQSSQQGEEKSTEEPQFVINKTALVEKGKILDDFLETEEIPGASLLSKSSKYLELPVEIDGRQNAVRIKKEKVRTKAEIHNGKILINVKLSLSIKNGTDFGNDKSREHLKSALQTKISESISAAINKALYQNETDIFGVRKLVRHSFPEFFLENENKPETMLRPVFSLDIIIK